MTASPATARSSRFVWELTAWGGIAALTVPSFRDHHHVKEMFSVTTRSCMRTVFWEVTLVCLVATSAAHAHGGGLNKDGCHTNHKTGDYHCHRGGSGSGAASTGYSAASQLAPSPSPSGRASGYANCAEARAAGAAPLYRGDPGYAAHLDRDDDGIACEPYRGRR